MKIVVVTGGIGSGKSEVCRILSDMGLDLQYHADDRVKRLYAEHPSLLDDIESQTGCLLRDDAGVFVPSRLAERIFADADALKLVESLVFPALMDDFKEFCTINPGHEVVIFESATILEKPQFDGFGDIVVLIDAPFDIRLKRACVRDNADRDKVLARMSNQKLMNSLSEGMTDPRIDAVIMNDGNVEDLEAKVKIMVETILSDC